MPLPFCVAQLAAMDVFVMFAAPPLM